MKPKHDFKKLLKKVEKRSGAPGDGLKVGESVTLSLQNKRKSDDKEVTR